MSDKIKVFEDNKIRAEWIEQEQEWYFFACEWFRPNSPHAPTFAKSINI